LAELLKNDSSVDFFRYYTLECQAFIGLFTYNLSLLILASSSITFKWYLFNLYFQFWFQSIWLFDSICFNSMFILYCYKFNTYTALLLLTDFTQLVFTKKLFRSIINSFYLITTNTLTFNFFVLHRLDFLSHFIYIDCIFKRDWKLFFYNELQKKRILLPNYPAYLLLFWVIGLRFFKRTIIISIESIQCVLQ